MTFLVEKRALPPSDAVRRPPIALRTAHIREGNRGDWGVTAWFETEAEAHEIAGMINERLRKQGVEP
jgi:hypothetical protein